jgi:hypothetical protein
MAFESWRRPDVRSVITICAVSALLCSCGSSKSVELAKRNVEQFHSELDSEQYAAVYAACDEKFQQVSTESEFARLLEAIHGKLGNVQKADLRDTRTVSLQGEGAMVTLEYETKFAEGTGTEKFSWHIKDRGAALYRYEIDSDKIK